MTTPPRLIDFGDDWDREPRPDQLPLFDPPPARPAPIPPPYLLPRRRRVEDADIREDLL
jgi:hypothetical protein